MQTKMKTSTKISVGIDFGTTKSEIVFWKNPSTRPEIIKDTFGDTHIQSSIAILNGKEYIVGKNADNYPDSRKIIDNKRFIGRRFSEIPSTIHISKYPFHIKQGLNDSIYYVLPAFGQFTERSITPIEIATINLQYLMMQIIRVLGHKPKNYTITVPAYFDSQQKKATLQAGLFSNILLFLFQFSERICGIFDV